MPTRWNPSCTCCDPLGGIACGECTDMPGEIILDPTSMLGLLTESYDDRGDPIVAPGTADALFGAPVVMAFSGAGSCLWEGDGPDVWWLNVQTGQWAFTRSRYSFEIATSVNRWAIRVPTPSFILPLGSIRTIAGGLLNYSPGQACSIPASIPHYPQPNGTTVPTDCSVPRPWFQSTPMFCGLIDERWSAAFTPVP